MTRRELESGLEHYKQKYKDVADRCDALEQAVHSQKEQIALLQRQTKELGEIKAQNKELIATINFLCREKFEDDKIEFAAIKTYRNGWQTFYLHGNKMKIKRENDVSIYSEPGFEPVRVTLES